MASFDCIFPHYKTTYHSILSKSTPQGFFLADTTHKKYVKNTFWIFVVITLQESRLNPWLIKKDKTLWRYINQQQTNYISQFNRFICGYCITEIVKINMDVWLPGCKPMQNWNRFNFWIEFLCVHLLYWCHRQMTLESVSVPLITFLKKRSEFQQFHLVTLLNANIFSMHNIWRSS